MSAGSTALSYEEAACEAARLGGGILRRHFGRTIRVERKGLHDFVTEVDREAEAVIVAYLQGRFPGHAVQAEEGSPATAEKHERWIVDPLDGTTNFIHGVGTFAVSIAFARGEELVAGAVHDPVRDETFHASGGNGARLNGRAIACSPIVDLHDSLIATGFPFRELARLDGYLAAFEAFIRTTAGLRRAGSAALDLAYTACGRYDGFWEIGLSPWDLAAGALLVQEAGGIVTDVEGGSNFLTRGDIVASAPAIHPEMLRIVRDGLERGTRSG